MHRSIKITAVVAGLSLAVASAAHADVLLFEDFEDATVTYTTTAATASVSGLNYFGRINDGPTGGNVSTNVVFNGDRGTFAFGASNIDAATTGHPSNGMPNNYTQDIYFSSIDISNATDMVWSAYFAEDDNGTSQNWDSNDYLHVDYSIDGAPYIGLFWIQSASSGSSVPRVDTDFNGVGEGTEITSTFTQFSRAINRTGDLLTFRVRIASDAQQDDIAFDDFQFTATIPEPATASLFGLGALALLRRRRA